MKELSIEEKAKRYDEAFEIAKITLDCCDSASIITKNTIYSIFPELTENQDKELKKAAYNYALAEQYPFKNKHVFDMVMKAYIFGANWNKKFIKPKEENTIYYSKWKCDRDTMISNYLKSNNIWENCEKESIITAIIVGIRYNIRLNQL